MRPFETITHAPLTFDEHCKMFPSERILSRDGVTVTKYVIAYSKEVSKIVYFVDGTNGDHYGQYASKEDATNKFKLMVGMKPESRSKFDI